MSYIYNCRENEYPEWLQIYLSINIYYLRSLIIKSQINYAVGMIGWVQPYQMKKHFIQWDFCTQVGKTGGKSWRTKMKKYWSFVAKVEWRSNSISHITPQKKSGWSILGINGTFFKRRRLCLILKWFCPQANKFSDFMF